VRATGYHYNEPTAPIDMGVLILVDTVLKPQKKVTIFYYGPHVHARVHVCACVRVRVGM
jgi:hypothetical protein